MNRAITIFLPDWRVTGLVAGVVLQRPAHAWLVISKAARLLMRAA